ncbi:MAG: preprotein translocase subunit SecG [Clostridia bacterium]|nr:preprotein translocase subunit SecG [Clostridia bacterium]
MNVMNMMMASSGGFWNAWPVIKIIALCIMLACALFIILVVLFQPGNSSGISAINGSSETFYSKNKGKTMEHKMKKLTVISGIVFAVLCVVFAIIAALS